MEINLVCIKKCSIFALAITEQKIIKSIAKRRVAGVVNGAVC